MITSSSNAQVKQMIQLNKKARERRNRMFYCGRSADVQGGSKGSAGEDICV